MEVVVVLPWVPQTQMQSSNHRLMSPSSTIRSMVGTPLCRAATSSGLSSIMAAVWTIRSAPAMFSAFCPMVTGMPSARSASMVSPGVLSEPLMVKPSPWRICTMGYIPEPPIPIKWICFLPSKMVSLMEIIMASFPPRRPVWLPVPRSSNSLSLLYCENRIK